MSMPVSEPRPSDQQARDRLTDELDKTLFVEAGAGSGKTRAIVARILKLIVTGKLNDIAHLGAITFTEAAATQLHLRVREALESYVRQQSHETAESTRARDALERIDEATISTLHGLAFRLLSEFPVEAGLPPGFEVVDEIESHVENSERWDAFINDLFIDPNYEPVLRRAFTLGLKMNQLRAVAVEYFENWDRLEVNETEVSDDFELVPTLLPINFTLLIECLDEAVSYARQCSNTGKTVERVCVEFGQFRDLLRADSDPNYQLTVVQYLAPSFRAPGRVTDVELVALKTRIETVKAEYGQVMADLRLNALAPLLASVCHFTLEGARSRREQGRIGFHDLLVLARRLLLENEHVRRVLGNRYQRLFIDEFQDTDPLQADIALLLALHDPAVVSDSIGDVDIEEGRLFFVGDPKQSIYRFRRADIGVFERVRDRFSQNGIVELNVNFRTVPKLLAWVNELFTNVIGPEGQPGQPPYRALDAFRESIGEESPVVVIGGPIEVERAAGLRERECPELAALIQQMKSERWLVRHEGESGPRPLQFRDVTILIPSRQVLAELERALDDCRVPYRVESRSLVFGTDEVRELLAILQAIDDPSDEVAVVAALRSPAFACSDDLLARYRANGGRWNYLRTPDLTTELGDGDPVIRAMSSLRRLHDEHMWVAVDVLVERVIRDRRMVELTMARRRPRDHWRRLRMLADEARRFVQAGGLALADFIAYMEQQADEGAMRVETVVSEADDDAVRILTIHGSKGLEFPVVVLAGLGIEYRPPSDRVFWTDHGPEVALGPQGGDRFETRGYAGVRDEERDLDRHERDRLLYVAATRARDHLVVSLYHQAGIECAAKRIYEHIETLEGLHRRLDMVSIKLPDFDRDASESLLFGNPRGSDEHISEGVPLAPSLPTTSSLDRWRSARTALIEEANRPTAMAPTAIAKRYVARDLRSPDQADREQSSPDPSGVLEVSEPGESPDAPGVADEHRFGRRGHAGTAVGRAVHATLQIVDLGRPADLELIARTQAQAEGVASRATTVERLARSALESPSVREAVASGRYWREIFVAAPVGRSVDLDDRTIVEGYIDLLYETPDGQLVVVDYKTDQARNDDEIDASVARYRLQGAAYVAAIESAIGRRVARCVFVFARVDVAIERFIDDLPSAIADVEVSLTK